MTLALARPRPYALGRLGVMLLHVTSAVVERGDRALCKGGAMLRRDCTSCAWRQDDCSCATAEWQSFLGAWKGTGCPSCATFGKHRAA
jgi:hypothetical protein